MGDGRTAMWTSPTHQPCELMLAVTLPLVLASIPALAGGAYLARLGLAARRISAPAPNRSLRFSIVVPAHDEATGIVRTVQSLLALDYPPELCRVVVVADNCTDATATLARGAGAMVLERNDTTRRGKGYALMFAYDAVIRDAWADAIVVVDADTIVSTNLLTAAGARLANGEECAQAEYGVRNADESWRTRLMSLAFTLHHTLRSLGRERLMLSCGLRGNGMAFRTALLKRIPHQSTALAEDVEYGLALGLAGVRVAYLHEATVLGEMPATEAASRTQRDRWERGRRELTRQWSKPLLRAALARNGTLARDLLADLWVPPLVSFSTFVTTGCSLSVLLWTLGWADALAPLFWAFSFLLLLVYIGRGCALSPAGWRVIRDVVWVPVYVFWKFSARLRPARGSAWVRTARVATPDADRDEVIR